MSAQETVIIESADDFARLLIGWHSEKIAVLKHFLEIPEGTDASEDDGQSVKLVGDARKAFIIGVKLAIEELGTLPFEAELEDVPEPDPNQATLDLAPVQH